MNNNFRRFNIRQVRNTSKVVLTNQYKGKEESNNINEMDNAGYRAS